MAYPIDIETEALQFDGAWHTREALARLIKRQLDANDFAVGRPAAALEHLNQTLAALRTVALRVLPEMQEQLTREAARQGRPVGALVRDAIAAYLGMAAPEHGTHRTLQSLQPLPPTGRRPTDPEVSLPGIEDTQLMELPPLESVPGTALSPSASAESGRSVSEIVVSVAVEGDDLEVAPPAHDAANGRRPGG